MADFGGDIEAFRHEVRGWIDANFPAELKGRLAPSPLEGRGRITAPQERWRQAVAEKGWGVPTWSTAYGGAGLEPGSARVISEEFARAGAYNPIGGFGLTMLAPTLFEFGAEAQKLEHLPPIARGELQWCQGYSEPGAGSDLASLQTRATDQGDHFLVNGQKIWTSGAQFADWCFCLVRTDTAKKHEGISFVLISMRQPGVDPRPIRLIGGTSSFCETFFTDAVAHKKDLVGPLNGGWTVAKRLLQHERSTMGAGRGMGESQDSLPVLARTYLGVDAAGRLADADLRTRIILNEMEGRALQQTQVRAQQEARASAGPNTTTSVMKNASTRYLQQKAELALEILGHQGLGWDGETYSAPERGAVRSWLGGKAFTIFGGSQEIQDNIISKRILGLPDPNAG